MAIRLITILFLIIMFYYWTVTQGYNTFYLDQDHGGYYNHLINGFLKGNLYLDIEPRPELLALADPWDPAQNGPYRLHDASLYNNKYYIYFGPTPAITLFLPYFLFFGRHMSESLEMFIFSVGGFLWTVALLILLKRNYFNKIPEWMLLFSIIIMGFSNIIPYLLRRPAIWEAAIACGYFYFSASLFWFCLALNFKIPKVWMLALGSLFFGLSVGSRPNFIFFTILFPLIYKKTIQNINDKSLNNKRNVMMSLLLPLFICLTLLGTYNYKRFNNPLEFGMKYVTGQHNTPKHKCFQLSNIPYNIYFNLLQPPTINSTFPFVHLLPSFPSFISLPKDYYYILETVGGIFTCVPFCLLLLTPALFFYLKRKNSKFINDNFYNDDTIRFPVLEFLIITIPAIYNLLLIFTAGSTSTRYHVDYVPYFLLGACIIWFNFDLLMNKTTRFYYWTKRVIILLGIFSSLFGIAYSIKGQYNGLHDANIKKYSKLENQFKPLSNLIAEIAPLWGQK